MGRMSLFLKSKLRSVSVSWTFLICIQNICDEDEHVDLLDDGIAFMKIIIRQSLDVTL